MAALDSTEATWLVAYDIADPRRLRRVHRVCRRFGDALQKSVYVCHVSAAELASLQAALARVLRPDVDSVRYQPACAADLRRGLLLGLQRAPGQQASAWVI